MMDWLSSHPAAPSPNTTKTDVVAVILAYKVEQGGVQGPPQIHGDFRAILGYMTLCLKKNNK